MEAKHLNTTVSSAMELLPSEALTRFLPLDTEIAAPEPASHTETLFAFRVGSLGFLVNSNTYCEIIEQLTVNPLPNVESWFNGLINLRGNLVPVIDLQLLLNDDSVSSSTPKKRQLFAIGQGDKTMAFWIDGLPEIKSALSQPLKQLPPLPAILQHCVLAAYLQEEQLWFNIEFDALFKTLGRQYAMEESVS